MLNDRWRGTVKGLVDFLICERTLRKTSPTALLLQVWECSQHAGILMLLALAPCTNNAFGFVFFLLHY